MSTLLLALAAAYAAGAIPFGYLLVKLQSGAANTGGANVLRTNGIWAGALTLLLDLAKGWFAVWLMDRASGRDPLWMCAAALAAVAGHAFPIFLRFRGGKPVATFFGAWSYIAPVPVAAVLVLFVAVTLYSRHVSLGSVMAAASFPLGVWLIDHPGTLQVLAAALAAALVVWRHRTNLRRIRAGTEDVLTFRL
jgi:glycerol-3-phosphate acyltransferase PlsY